MSAGQGKYFLVEEAQAHQSVDENVVELAFAMRNIQIPKKKRTAKEPMPMLRFLFTGRSAAQQQLPVLANSSSSSAGSNALAKPSPGKGVAAPRESKTGILFPTCMIKVFAPEKDVSIDQINLPYNMGEGWREIYQSDIHRIYGNLPVTVPALLLLPMPPVVTSKGMDKRDRPLRIELWVSQPSAKKATPDILSGYCETTLGRILNDTGSPRRSPNVPQCVSSWKRMLLHPLDSTDPSRLILPGYDSASQTYIDNCSQLHVRIAFPDRLISVAIPRNRMEENSTEWRLAPPLSGLLLRGLTFCPVSRGFQALYDQQGDASISKPSSPNKVPTNLIEFREEMAEMPLNLVVPACFLEQATLMLEQASSTLVARTRNEIARFKKVTQSELGLNAADLKEKRIVDSADKLERFAADAAQRGLERCAEMREVSKFYREQWVCVVAGTVGPDKKILRQKATMLKQLLTTMENYRAQSQMSDGAATSASQYDSRFNSSVSDLDPLEVPPPPPATPSEADDTKSTTNPTAANVLNNATAADEDNDIDEDEREEKELKDSFEKVVGVTQVTASQGEEILTTFRPSTSRKDRRMRFMPINMHMQVLTVRDTYVKLPLEKKQSTVGMNAKGGRIRKSVVDYGRGLLGSSKALIEKKISKDEKDSTKHLSKDSAGIVPPTIEESDGPLALASRRRKRQSILETTLDSGGEGFPGSQARRNRLTSTSSNQTTPSRKNTAFDDFEDDPDAVPTVDSFFYDTISAGAPSAHHLTSKTGGLWQMFKDLGKAKNEMRHARDEPRGDLVAKLESYRKAKELEWAFGERCDVVLPQSLSILVGSVIARLYVMAAEQASSGVKMPAEEGDDEVAESIVRNGFLIGWESLLSTHKKELAMLGDLCYAVRYLSEHVVLRFEVLPVDDDDEEDDSSYTVDDELRDARYFLSKAVDIRLFRTNTKKESTSGGGEGEKKEPVAWIGPGNLDDGTIWLVAAKVPSTVVDKLPKVLREYIRQSDGPDSLFSLPITHVVDVETLNPAPLPWTCVLFTQGINEMQNLANMMGTRALQEEINEYSCDRLIRYCKKRFDIKPSTSASIGHLSVSSSNSGKKKLSVLTNSSESGFKEDDRGKRRREAYSQSVMWAAKLKRSVSGQANIAKSFEILQMSADLVRWLSGIRIASCKSAKDRTAMSLTWEEARLLHNVHKVCEIPLLDLANLFREHGTRLINVHKNTGVPRYAFNKTQRSFLPEFYRPPPNTIGGYFGMSNVT